MGNIWFAGLGALKAFLKGRFKLLLRNTDHVTWGDKTPGESLNIKPYRHGFPTYVGSFHLQWQYAAFFVISNEETWNFHEML